MKYWEFLFPRKENIMALLNIKMLDENTEKTLYDKMEFKTINAKPIVDEQKEAPEEEKDLDEDLGFEM